MAQVIWTEPALSDLTEIADYIALDKFGAAQQLIRHIFSSVERLERFPETGRVPPELKDSQYRELIISPCRIFYKYHQNKIYILYIIRCERQLRKFLLDHRATEC